MGLKVTAMVELVSKYPRHFGGPKSISFQVTSKKRLRIS